MEFCNSTAIVHLQNMMDGVHSDAIDEWIYSIAKLNQIVPSEYLPYLLDLSTSDSVLRPYVVKIGGEKIVALAQTRKKWKWVGQITQDLPGYLMDARIKKSEDDAMMIGYLAHIIRNPESHREGIITSHIRFQRWLPKFKHYRIKLGMSIPLTKIYMRAVFKDSAQFHKDFPFLCSPSLPLELYRRWKAELRNTAEFLYWSEEHNHSLSNLLNIFDYRRQMLMDIGINV